MSENLLIDFDLEVKSELNNPLLTPNKVIENTKIGDTFNSVDNILFKSPNNVNKRNPVTILDESLSRNSSESLAINGAVLESIFQLKNNDTKIASKENQNGFDLFGDIILNENQRSDQIIVEVENAKDNSEHNNQSLVSLIDTKLTYSPGMNPFDSILFKNKQITDELNLNNPLSEPLKDNKNAELINLPGLNPFDEILLKSLQENKSIPGIVLNESWSNKSSKSNPAKNLLIDFENSLEKSLEKNKSIQSKENSKFLSFKRFHSLDLSNSSFEDLMSIEPKWLESDSESTESDFEMFKIPMLEKLDVSNDKTVTDFCLTPENNTTAIDTKTVTISKNIEEIKEKLNIYKRNQDTGKKDISDITPLMNNLKQIILDLSDQEKKSTAKNLLESLESLFNNNQTINSNKNENKHNFENGTTPKSSACMSRPKNIIKQNTFHLENYDKSENDDNEIIKMQDDTIIQSPLKNIIKKIDRILEENNVEAASMVGFETKSSAKEIKPTYILVMSTPKPLTRQATEIFDELSKSNNNQSNFRPRSSSVGASESISNKDKLIESNSKSNVKNQQRLSTSLNNRKSINLTPNSKQLIQNKKEINKPKMPTELPKTKLRIKTNTGNLSNQKGPIKANIPIKNVSTIKNSTVITQNSRILPSQSSSSTLNTSSKTRPRLSYLSVTPNPKSQTKTTTNARRTFSSGNPANQSNDFSKITNKFAPVQMGSQLLKFSRKSIYKENNPEENKKY